MLGLPFCLYKVVYNFLLFYTFPHQRFWIMFLMSLICDATK